MLPMFNTHILGIDIGTSAIKMAHLSKQKNVFHLHHCDIIEIESRLVDERGSILDVHKLSIYLNQLIQKSAIKTKKCVLAVPSQAMIQDIVELNADMDANDQMYDLELEASRMMPPSMMPSFDYHLRSQTSQKQQFELFVTPKDLIDQRVELIEKLTGAKQAYVIDGEDFALLRTLHYVWQSEQMIEQIRVVLRLGHVNSKMFVLRDNDVIYQQDLVINGLQLTQQIMRYYNFSYADANEKKQLRTLPPGYKEEVLMPYIENASIDILQAIQNFFSSSNFSRVDAIFACGGHALTEDLINHITQKTHIPTQLINPFFGLIKSNHIDEVLLRNKLPQFATAIGLAMRGLAE